MAHRTPGTPGTPDTADRRTDRRRAVLRERIKHRPTGLIVALVVAVAVAITLVVALIDGDGDAVDRTETPAALPGWLQEVTPPPGAQLNGAITVSVDPDLLAADREVRLVIDGVDVTNQMTGPRQFRERTGPIDPGPIVYDPQATAEPLVELRPGRHEAEARLVEYPEGVVEGEGVVLERFAWEFQIF